MNLPGNQAFVQSLYLQFLRLAGDVTNPNEAGLWVNHLNAGMSTGAAAEGIIRSEEALGHVVDELYRSILGRQADPEGRRHHINLLANGQSIETVQINLLAGTEFRVRFPSDTDFIVTLYELILQRNPQGGVATWYDRIPVIGRSGVAEGFLHSDEYRIREVRNLYFNLLKRPATDPPSEEAVAEWVNTKMDMLSLRVAFASSEEFYVRAQQAKLQR